MPKAVHCADCSATDRPCVVCGVRTMTSAPAGEPVACCFGHHNDAIDYGYLDAWFDKHSMEGAV